MIGPSIFEKLWEGCVIPAHPLALTAENKLDERHQRALTRYYLAAGAGGLAVGVHTTQFAIHDPKVGLYKPVLELAISTAEEAVTSHTIEPPIMIAGLVGNTAQAVREARLAADLGYHLGLLSLTALRGKPVDALIDHAGQVAEVIPIMGFYLQSAISGMMLPKEFWSRLVQIPNVRAIKIAPFNRYQTLDVLEAVAQSGRQDSIALYTGNDDNILIDLVTRYTFRTQQGDVPLHIVGGLLGLIFALPLRPGITFTYHGLAVNARAQVLDAHGSPFPNLFAAGEVMSGNILSDGYLAGFGVAIGHVFGRIAGREAAAAAH